MGNQVSGTDSPTPLPPSAMVELRRSSDRSRSSSGSDHDQVEDKKFGRTLSDISHNATSLLKDLTAGVTKELKDMKDIKDLQEQQEQEEAMSAGSMSGWLQKLPVIRNNNKPRTTLGTGSKESGWKRRFFVLKRNCLYYYVDQIEATFKDTEKPIVECESRLPRQLTATHFGYTFKLTFDKKMFNLAAFSEAELDSWLSFMRSTDPNKKKEGWLMVKMLYKGWYGNNEKWETKYFSMKGDSMEYSHRKQHGYFPIAGSTVDISEEDEYSFSIVNSTQYVSLRADSVDTRMQWAEAIRKEVKRLEEMNESLTDPIELELSEKIHEFLIREKQERELLKTLLEKQQKDTKKYYILSLDGGGIRGIITTGILERVVKEFPDFLEHVDMIAGCSNGGMVAMGLAFEHDPKFCRGLVEILSNLIFKESGLLNKMNSAKFSNASLKVVCQKIWGDKKLRDASKKVVIPAFLMDNHHSDERLRSCETKLFHNLSDNDPLSDELVSDVVMRTGAAPTFFPSFQQYVDGGMFAHDPASAALNLAMSPKRLGIRPENIVMLSLGTGHVNHYYDDPTHNWGYVQWVPRLGTCFWDGMLKKSELLCREMLDDRYHRLDPLFEKDIPMDDPLQIPKLTEIAKQLDLTETFKWIRKNIYGQDVGSTAQVVSVPVHVSSPPISPPAEKRSSKIDPLSVDSDEDIF